MNLTALIDGKIEVVFTLEDLEKVRNGALKLYEDNIHPRYALYLADLFKAANAIINELKNDKMKSGNSVFDE